MASYVLMAMTNAVEGREEDYNRWFDAVHIPEVLAAPGFVSAQRMEMTPQQRMPPPFPYHFAALYQIETDDLEATLAALGEALQKGSKTDASDPSRRAIWVYRTLGPERRA